MEGFAILGIIANITQLLEQGISLTGHICEIWKNGQMADNSRLRETLSTISAVTDACSGLSPANRRNKTAPQISDCALKGFQAAKILESCLNRIKYEDAARTIERSIAGKTWNSAVGQSKIEDLRKRFESFQQALQTAILREIHYCIVSVQDEHGRKLVQVLHNSDGILRILQGNSSSAERALNALEYNLKLSYDTCLEKLAKRIEELTLDGHNQLAQRMQ